MALLYQRPFSSLLIAWGHVTHEWELYRSVDAILCQELSDLFFLWTLIEEILITFYSLLGLSMRVKT